MNWREDLIAQHEKAVGTLQQGLDWMREGNFSTFELGLGGAKVNTTAASIETYERMIADLRVLIGQLKSGEI